MSSTVLVSPVEKNKRALSELKATGQGYTVGLVRALPDFKKLELEWNALVALSGVTQFNVSFSWQYAWAKNFSPENLFIITVRSKAGQLVGLFPLKRVLPKVGVFRRLVKHLQFIGTEPCLYEEVSPLIAKTESEAAVISAFSECLLEHKNEWDFLDLRYVSNKPMLERLAEKLNKATQCTVISETMPFLYMTLPDSMETYLTMKTHRKKRQRYNYSYNTLKKINPPHEPILKVFENGTPEALDHLERLMEQHIAYWAERGVESNFAKYEGTRQFYIDLLNGVSANTDDASANRCVFSALMLGDVVLSYEFGFLWDGSQNYLYNIGVYNQDSLYKKGAPGLFHVELLVRKGIEKEGDTQTHFGRGDELYKTRWCDCQDAMWNLQVYRTALSYALIQGDEKIKAWMGKDSFFRQK